AAAALAFALAAAIAGGAAPAARAETKPAEKADPQKLKDVEARIKREREAATELARRTEAIREEIRGLRDKLVKSAAATQTREVALPRRERGLRALEGGEKAAAADFQKRQQQLAETLAALQRLSLRPPVTLASRSDDANDAVRTALVLRSLVPEL